MQEPAPYTIPRRSGFTLIELSIVLVITGLIAGGIMVGRDLIAAANIRAQVKQLEQFSAASNAFRLKYDQLAGDMPRSIAQSFGLPYSILASGAFPNGDGQITGDRNTPDSYTYGSFIQEPAWFFPQLSAAGLIAGSYTQCGKCAINGNKRVVGTDYPALALDPTTSLLPITAPLLGDGIWFFLSIKNNAANMYWNYQFSPSPTMAPAIANALDMKIDDGIPSKGMVRAIEMKWNFVDEMLQNDTLTGEYPGSGNCVISAAATNYNLASTTLNCRIAYKLQ